MQPRVNGRFAPTGTTTTIATSQISSDNTSENLSTSLPDADDTSTLASTTEWSLASLMSTPAPGTPNLPTQPPPTPQPTITPLRSPSPHIMTSNSSMDLFSGDGDDKQQPMDFLKKFRHAMHDTQTTQDALLVKAFGDYLKTDSPAKEWYTNQNTLATAPTWDALEIAF
jgi:hypothetical protein